MRRFIAELRRRHVFSVGLVYLVVAVLLVPVVASTYLLFAVPRWAPTLALALLALGFPMTVWLAWAYDITRHGIVRTRGSARADAAARRLAARTVHALAVVPFACERQYLGDGIAEGIRSALASIEELRVAELGRRDDVDLALEGTVSTAADRVIIGAKLIDVATGDEVWAHRFDRVMRDVFAVQDDIVCDIASALSVTEPVPPSARFATPRIEAYDAYLRGLSLRHDETVASVRAARELFQQATALDPEYAIAWTAVADASSFLYMNGEPSDANRRSADQCSLAAVELGPELAEAHAARGLAHTLCGRHADAAREYECARELDPRRYEAVIA